MHIFKSILLGSFAPLYLSQNTANFDVPNQNRNHQILNFKPSEKTALFNGIILSDKTDIEQLNKYWGQGYTIFFGWPIIEFSGDRNYYYWASFKYKNRNLQKVIRFEKNRNLGNSRLHGEVVFCTVCNNDMNFENYQQNLDRQKFIDLWGPPDGVDMMHWHLDGYTRVRMD